VGKRSSIINHSFTQSDRSRVSLGIDVDVYGACNDSSGSFRGTAENQTQVLLNYNSFFFTIQMLVLH
jgi:hypothetical protein